LSFGISAIGKLGRTYNQNVRTLDEYYGRLDEGVLPCFRGWQLDADDLLRRDVIQALMCQFTVDVNAIQSKHDISFGDYFSVELDALDTMAADGLVEVAPDRITVTSRGRLLVRTVAMVFDRHLRTKSAPARYSRVI
jgi:oxygen-independent coproporphyrinogen-3 oxidase